MTEPAVYPTLAVTPAGHLMWSEAGLEPWPVEGAAERTAAAFARGSAEGLLHLAAREAGTQLPAAAAYWRRFARFFLTRFCHRPESGGLDQPTPIPAEAEFQEWVDGAPPMEGGEYLSVAALRGLWVALDEHARDVANTGTDGASAFLRGLGAQWHLVGRVCLHLAENRKNDTHPFAFLATYSSGLSEGGQVRHRPLGQALREYAGEGNKEALLKLLTPVNRAAEKSTFVRSLVESGALFKPLAWRPAEAYGFLKEIPLFEASGLAVRLPDLWGGKRPARPKVSVRVGEKRKNGLGVDALLDFQVQTTLDGEELTPEEWRALMESSGGLALIRGRWVEADPEKLRATLEQWKKAEKAAGGEWSMAEALRALAGLDGKESAPAGEEAEARTWMGVEAGSWLSETLAALRDPAKLAESGGWGALDSILRPYQKTGAGWLRFLGELGLGACLADDMGLGKTLQMLAVLTARAKVRGSGSAKPSLLVAPASLLANWRAEIQRFAPSLRHRILHPSELGPEEWKKAQTDPAAAVKGCDLAMTTYGMVARWEGLRRVEWDFVILDEAQAIKNPAARQTKAVKELRAAKRVALSGTPIENRLGDLWSLFDFLNPGLLGSAKRFASFVKESEGSGERLGALRSLVRPYILRRMKTDKRIIADLPDKTEVKAFCGLSKKQAALYEQAVGELTEKVEGTDGIQRRGVVLAAIMRFKQICNHPSQWLRDQAYEPEDSGKFMRLRELVAEIAQRQEKALVFTQFQEMTEPLAACLAKVFGRPGLILHGAVAIKDRRRLVDTFQTEAGPPFFVLTTKAGGTGLNLTAASHVIHFDRWWNPAVENQATDRAFRIGQKKNVLVHKFVCRGTFEEKIDRLLEEKAALARDVVEGTGGETALTEMSDKELIRFVSLDIGRAVEAE
jgi:superfamily II DNA or RNA helicase